LGGQRGLVKFGIGTKIKGNEGLEMKKIALVILWSPFLTIGFVCGFVARGFLGGVRLADRISA